MKLGLKKGDKLRNRVRIPLWIKKDDKYLISCIRGLIDTDGYLGKYCERRDKYKWFQYHIGFTNHSINLIEDFIEFCNRFEIPVSRTHKFKANEGVLRILGLTKPFKMNNTNFNISELKEEFIGCS